MELRHVRYFIAVAEQLNFRSASKTIHVSQPAISKQIQQLEEEIGAELFQRERRRISLTVAGEVFLSRAYALLKNAQDAALEVKQAQAGLAGAVSIGFESHSAFVVLPRLLTQFRAEVPQAKVRLRELSASEQMKALSNREIDLAIVYAQNHSHEFESMLLARENFTLALSLQHPLARMRVARLERFLGDTLFLPSQEESAGVREAILSTFVQYGGVPSDVQAVESVQTALCLTAAGLGIAVVPESAKATHMEGVTYRPLRRPAIPVTTHGIWRHNDELPLLRALKSSLDKVRSSLAGKS